jgi:hypothetical protein
MCAFSYNGLKAVALALKLRSAAIQTKVAAGGKAPGLGTWENLGVASVAGTFYRLIFSPVAEYSSLSRLLASGERFCLQAS